MSPEVFAMGNGVVDGLESRFERYSEVMVKALGHASRGQAARWYLRGLMLPAKAYRTVTWREGTNTRLGSRFARVRCSAAHHNRPRKEQWLIIDWPEGEAQPTQYFLSNLPEDTSFKTLVHALKMRWRIEHDYRELKEEMGLDHYEGRNWRGFHHHASLSIPAFGFLMLEWLSGIKKNAAQLQAPALPQAFRPRGARPDAAPRAVVNRNPARQTGSRHRS